MTGISDPVVGFVPGVVRLAKLRLAFWSTNGGPGVEVSLRPADAVALAAELLRQAAEAADGGTGDQVQPDQTRGERHAWN